jgi:hypothetical protein
MPSASFSLAIPDARGTNRLQRCASRDARRAPALRVTQKTEAHSDHLTWAFRFVRHRNRHSIIGRQILISQWLRRQAPRVARDCNGRELLVRQIDDRLSVRSARRRSEGPQIAFLIGRNLVERMKRPMPGFLHRMERNNANLVRMVCGGGMRPRAMAPGGRVPVGCLLPLAKVRAPASPEIGASMTT